MLYDYSFFHDCMEMERKTANGFICKYRNVFFYVLIVRRGEILWVNCLRVLTEMCFWCAAPQSFAWGGKCSSRWPCWTAVSSPPWWGQRSDPPGPASGVTSLPVHSHAWQSTIHASGMKTVENIYSASFLKSTATHLFNISWLGDQDQ